MMEHVTKDDREVVMNFITDFSRRVGARWYGFDEQERQHHYHKKEWELEHGRVVFTSLNAFLNNYRFTLEQGFDAVQYRVRLPEGIDEVTGNSLIAELNSFPYFYFSLVDWIESITIADRPLPGYHVDSFLVDSQQIIYNFMKDYEGNYRGCLEFTSNANQVEVLVELVHSNGGRTEYLTPLLTVKVDIPVMLDCMNRFGGKVYDTRYKYFRSTNDNMEGLLHISQTDEKQ